MLYFLWCKVSALLCLGVIALALLAVIYAICVFSFRERWRREREEQLRRMEENAMGNKT